MLRKLTKLLGIGDDDDDPNSPLLPLNGYTNEDDDDDDEEVVEEIVWRHEWETEQDYANFVFECIERTRTPYFEMYSTEEYDCDSEKKVKVWWMQRTHPYAAMIRVTNFKSSKVRYPCFDKHLNSIIYCDNIIEKAIEQIVCIFQEYQLLEKSTVFNQKNE